MSGKECDQFPQIKTGPATKGDHAVMATIIVGFDTRCGVLLVRVRINVAEHRAAKARRVKQVERPGGDVHARKATVSDQERLFDPRNGASIGDLGNAASAETDSGRVGPVGSNGHVFRPSLGGMISDGSDCDSR